MASGATKGPEGRSPGVISTQCYIQQAVNGHIMPGIQARTSCSVFRHALSWLVFVFSTASLCIDLAAQGKGAAYCGNKSMMDLLIFAGGCSCPLR